MTSPFSFNIHPTGQQQQSSPDHATTLSSLGPRRGLVTIAPHTKDPSPKKEAAKRVIETPGCFMYTIKGSVPHLTPDNLRLQSFGGVHVTMEHLLQDHHPKGLAQWPFDLSGYLNLQDLILLCDTRDPLHYQKLAPNTDRYISVTTHQGIRNMSVKDFVDIVKGYRPDIVVAMADNEKDVMRLEGKEGKEGKAVATATTTTSVVAGKEDEVSISAEQKKARRAVDRTLKWLDQILAERRGEDGLKADRDAEEAKIKKREERKARKKVEQLTKASGMEGVVDSSSSELTSAATSATTSAMSTPTIPSTATITEDAVGEASTVKTESWKDISVFAQVLGAHFKEERIRSAQETAKRGDVDGYILDMTGIATSASDASQEDKKESVWKAIQTSVEHLPGEKPKMVYGVHTPEDVLKAIALGVDLFETTYPYQLTEDGKGSLYEFGTSSSTITTTVKEQPRWINLWDEEHRDQFVPILEGCPCYACKDGRHTRAYINHLLKAHEMLATVLLMSHNMVQYSLLFKAIRSSLESGQFTQDSATFLTRFGASEPERTGEIHEAQKVVEASLSKRNRLDGVESGSASAVSTPEVASSATLSGSATTAAAAAAAAGGNNKNRGHKNKKVKRPESSAQEEQY